MDARYILAKFARFYGLTFEQALATRERLFWAMYSQIERLEAEDDVRSMVNARAAASQKDGFSARMDELASRIGKPIENPGAMLKAERDPDAGAKLKKLANVRG